LCRVALSFPVKLTNHADIKRYASASLYPCKRSFTTSDRGKTDTSSASSHRSSGLSARSQGSASASGPEPEPAANASASAVGARPSRSPNPAPIGTPPPFKEVAAIASKVTGIKDKLHVFKDYYKDELWTTPNIITYTRMVCSPLLGWAVVNDHKNVALAGCAIAAFSDWLDGYIAKNYDQMTVLGGMLDPAAGA